MLTVKGNQIQLEKEIEEYFEEAEEDDFDRSEIQNEETSDEGHRGVNETGKWSG